jgi:uncharacterized protein (TIGR03437 family)
MRCFLLSVAALFSVCGVAHSQPGAPSINAGGVVSAADGKAPVSRGSLVSAYGSAFSTQTLSATTLPLPAQLGTTSVAVDGKPAPLIFVSSGQINFQMPFEAATTGMASVTVTRDGITSSPVTVSLAEFAPGIFRSGAQPIVVHADGNLVTADKPAGLSEILVIYGTGLGGLNATPATGAATPASPVATARINPTVTVGSQDADLLFAGLTAGFVGLAQFNIRMPAGLPPGSPKTLALGFGDAGDSVDIAVSPGPLPQFSVNLTDVQPHSPVNGDDLQFEYTIRNPNNFKGTLLHVLYFSKNQTLTTSDQVLNASTALQSSTTQQFVFSNTPLPDSTAVGRYYVAVGVTVNGDPDPAHVVFSQSFPLDVIAQRSPFDLSVTLRGLAPTTAAAGSPISFTYSVQEPSGASGTFLRSLYIGTQSTVTANDTLINTRTFDLVRGAVSLTSSNNVIPAGLKPGNYFVAIILTNDGDTNSANNTSVALPITVTAATGTGMFVSEGRMQSETAKELKTASASQKP